MAMTSTSIPMSQRGTGLVERNAWNAQLVSRYKLDVGGIRYRFEEQAAKLEERANELMANGQLFTRDVADIVTSHTLARESMDQLYCGAIRQPGTLCPGLKEPFPVGALTAINYDSATRNYEQAGAAGLRRSATLIGVLISRACIPLRQKMCSSFSPSACPKPCERQATGSWIRRLTNGPAMCIYPDRLVTNAPPPPPLYPMCPGLPYDSP
jgi:hypothetical protein